MLKINNVDIKIQNNIVTFRMDIPNKIKEFFISDSFFIEYPNCYNLLECNRVSLLIPVQSILWMLCYILGYDLDLDVVDYNFYESMNVILKKYEKMYPNIKFGCNIYYRELIHNDYKFSNKSLLYFSGGVDCLSTLYTHYMENPILLTVYGINNGVVKNNNIIRKINLDKHLFIYTNIRNFINEKRFFELFHSYNPTYTFWNRYLQSVVFTCMSSPIVSLENINKIYYASTYDYRFRMLQYSSIPDIDNNISYLNCNVFHDGYEYTRLEKVKRCVDFIEKFKLDPILKVCFSKKIDSNCCNCYKCILTILELLSYGIDIKKYGFTKNYDLSKIYGHGKYVNINGYYDTYDNFIKNNIDPPKQLANFIYNKKRDFNVLL